MTREEVITGVDDMTESKHTPGPWEAYPSMDEYGSKIVIRSSANSTGFVGAIATVRTGMLHTEHNMEQKKNADLMLAAPAMLKALREIAKALSLDPEDYNTQSIIASAGKGNLGEPGEVIEALDDARDCARVIALKALAKAEGASDE